MKLAIIKTGGKQYVVTPGQKLKVEKLEGAEGSTVQLPALLKADGDAVKIGKPSLADFISATLIKTAKGEKINVVKFKRKVRYRRLRGHRQYETQLQIGQF